MVNVGNGNLLVQADDVDVPGRGIDLAFRRTYNSMSRHDTLNTDGSAASIYGNGWTTTFDAHLTYQAAQNVMSIYDIDGARYDYTADAQHSGIWDPPAGQHATLTLEQGGCYYDWTKKSGTVYQFFLPTSGCSTAAGYQGRVHELFARNHNNWLRFDYFFAGGDASTAQNITEIDAVHADAQKLVLKFATIGSASGPNELGNITCPDGNVINYFYDNAGNLTEVDRPGNSSVPTLREQYGWTGAYQLNYAFSPRWLTSSGNEGSYTWFTFDGSARLSGVQLYGTANWVIPDGSGTGSLLQPGIASGPQTIANATFTYLSGQTQFTDLDHHAITWYYDGIGRVTQTQAFTGNTSPSALLTYAAWDANNNLVETQDARANKTDFEYDSNGNTIAVALPSVTTNAGSFRPTSLYSYDANNNVIAYCDAVYTHQLARDWVSPPQVSDNLCPSSTGATTYTWDTASDPAEPFGRLASSASPSGYQRTFSYDSSAQGGISAGLPTTVQGVSYTQNDNTSRTPTQLFTYDAYGNLKTYNAGNGAWTLAYDAMNRLTNATDADSVTSLHVLLR